MTVPPTQPPPPTRRSSWVPVPEGSPFPVQNLPYGVFSRPGEPARVGVAIGDQVLDLGSAAADGLLTVPEGEPGGDSGPPPHPTVDPAWFAQPALNAFLAAGRPAWRWARARLTTMLCDPSYRDAVTPHLLPRAAIRSHLPWRVADYVDFYSSLHHATNIGRIFRPEAEPLSPNWRYLPVGYHGRAGTVVVSGTPVTRPNGQRKAAGEPAPTFGPSQRLDIEAEVGFVVGTPSRLGVPVPTGAVHEHVFGAVLVNDWSARDIQAWEYDPLGPFLGKSFATSVSPWVVPLDALEAARVEVPEQAPPPLPYLAGGRRWGLDLQLEVSLNGHVVARPPFAGMYWTFAHQLAHLTVNGASLRTGDLFASGTVSGPQRHERGSLIELTWNGRDPLELPDGSCRTFLHDHDTVSITASAAGPADTRLGFGEVYGTVRPAPRVPSGE
ncbi:MAG: fumarylacetoacetase [Carbonactinosporaceae bacterium]